MRTSSSPAGGWRHSAGGAGNVARFYAAARDVAVEQGLTEVEEIEPHRFAEPGETGAILAAAGFEAIECGLVPRSVRPPEPREFIRAVCLGPHLDLMPEPKRAPYLDAVLERLGPDPELDYVRLNISARKRAAPAS